MTPRVVEADGAGWPAGAGVGRGRRRGGGRRRGQGESAEILVLLGLLVLAGLTLPAQAQPSATVVVRSRSDQFVVTAPSGLPRPARPPAGSSPTLVDLSPDFAAISCERIKEALLRELGIRDVFAESSSARRVPITLNLVAPAAAGGDLAFAATRYLDRWDYRLQVPARVATEPFVRGVVHALLTMWANRNPGAHAAEIPAWLTEGLTRHLASVSQVELVLDRPEARGSQLPLEVSTRDNRQGDPMHAVRDRLRLRPALSFTDFSLPPATMEADALEHYRDSVHVFVTELLRWKEGRERLRRMLGLLPQHLNWQTAFFRAFQPRFERAIDVEKWWALTLVAFTGRDPAQTWTPELACQKLDDVLTVQAELRQASLDLPRHGQVNLQTVVLGWDRAQQQLALEPVMRELAAIQMRLPAELAQVADQYRSVLGDFLEKRGRSGYAPARKEEVPPTAAMLARQVVRRLDELDRRRQAFLEESASPH